jgi:hypothetical protein
MKGADFDEVNDTEQKHLYNTFSNRSRSHAAAGLRLADKSPVAVPPQKTSTFAAFLIF